MPNIKKWMKENGKSFPPAPQPKYPRCNCQEDCDDYKKESMNIYSSGNHVYFYDEITRETVMKMRKLIEKINQDFDTPPQPKGFFKKLFKKEVTTDKDQQIILHIHSYGGELHAGFNAMDFISDNRYPIITIGEGAIASAAVNLLIAGHGRYMQENAVLLIHQISHGMYGKYYEFEDEMHNLKILKELLYKSFKKKTDMTKEEFNKQFENERYLTAEEALEFGIIDSIICPEFEDEEE